MSDFTVIIPHRGSALGLWATLHSCEEDLFGLPFNYNYVVVSNGGEVDIDSKNIISHLKMSGRLLKHLHYDEPLSPPAARQRGANVADGELLFFFDNHCLVGKRYFERAVADFRERPIDMLHSATRFYAAEATHFHYQLKLNYNFWAESSTFPTRELTPYRIAAGGHGGFAVRKSVWDEVGGYGPESLFVGYAGEELIYDLKMWRFGKNNWIDPKLIHYHYAGDRGYSRHYTREYYTNLLVSALVVGGEKWLYKVFDSFLNGKHLQARGRYNWYDVLQTAYDRAADYARSVDAKSVMTLDELLVFFREQQIAM